MNRLRRWPLHPFLLGVSPVLALLAQNLTQVKLLVGGRAVLAALLLAGLLLGITRGVLKDRDRAAAITSLMLVLFFSYGHVYNALKQTEVAGILIGRHRVLGPLWVLALALGLWWIMRRMKAAQTTHETLNVVALAAFLIPLTQIVFFEARSLVRNMVPAQAVNLSSLLQVPEGQTPPDIYYIILDAYARSDVLQEDFDFDNTPFLNRLAEMGFYVAPCSLSNYAQTELSLTSSLNFNYLDTLGDHFVPENDDRSDLWPLIRENAVRRTLKGLGYSDVAFETGYYWTQVEGADFYLSSSTSALDALEMVEGTNSFEVLLVSTTAARFLTDAANVLPGFFGEAVQYPYQRHRERVLYDFNKLRSVPLSIAGPKFVFAHIVTPHEPFVFGPHGEQITLEEPLDAVQYARAYRDQVTFVNSQVVQVVKAILTTSPTPPIIVIQADHGSPRISHQGRMAILNAYYLPGGGDQLLYPSITPVNTFRVIFNHYFGGDFKLLEDRSYFSSYEAPFQFEPISQDATSCAAGGH